MLRRECDGFAGERFLAAPFTQPSGPITANGTTSSYVDVGAAGVERFYRVRLTAP